METKSIGDMIPVLKDGSVYEVPDGTTWRMWQLDSAGDCGRQWLPGLMGVWDLDLPACPEQKVGSLLCR